jgi:hypothetical protein
MTSIQEGRSWYGESGSGGYEHSPPFPVSRYLEFSSLSLPPPSPSSSNSYAGAARDGDQHREGAEVVTGARAA